MSQFKLTLEWAIILGCTVGMLFSSCNGINHDDTIHYILGSDSYYIKTDSAVYIYNRDGVIQSVTPIPKPKDVRK